MAGRATTCWKAYRERDELRQPLVIKDSWQYPEREEEGELLREATSNGVVNVARYYHYEAVRISGAYGTHIALDSTHTLYGFTVDYPTWISAVNGCWGHLYT